jgi:hypothetical protein
MPEASFDVTKAHRWFAVELNNRAWDLVEQSNRSSQEMDEMIDAAHAASAHWRAVGTPLNHMRAECLLATAYAVAGFGEAAVRHAEKCLLLSGRVGEEQTPLDRATAHGCAANAYRIAGDACNADAHQRTTADLAASLADADDRQLIARLYPHS